MGNYKKDYIVEGNNIIDIKERTNVKIHKTSFIIYFLIR